MPPVQPDPEPGSDATPASLTVATQTGPPLPAAYTPPAIIFRAPLEATAAFCGERPYGKSFGPCDALGTLNS